MFSFSFGEILVIATMGLIVIGPERLPETARFLAHWAKRIRRQVSEIQADIRREIKLEDAGGLEEMKSIHREVTQMGREAGATVRGAVRGVSEEVGKVQAGVVRGGNSEPQNALVKMLPMKRGEDSPQSPKPTQDMDVSQKIKSEEYQDLDERLRKVEDHCRGAQN